MVEVGKFSCACFAPNYTEGRIQVIIRVYTQYEIGGLRLKTWNLNEIPEKLVSCTLLWGIHLAYNYLVSVSNRYQTEIPIVFVCNTLIAQRANLLAVHINLKWTIRIQIIWVSVSSTTQQLGWTDTLYRVSIAICCQYWFFPQREKGNFSFSSKWNHWLTVFQCSKR